MSTNPNVCLIAVENSNISISINIGCKSKEIDSIN